MIYEYAVSPTICDNWQNLRFLISSFGKEEGRLLSDIPKKQWLQLAKKAVKQSNRKPVERKAMLEGIIKLKNKAMYKRNFVPTVSGTDWIEHALGAHKNRPFRAILSDNCYTKEKYILANDFELTGKNLWKVPQGLMVKRMATEMLEPIKTMLDCACDVILIDRNFDPGKARFANFLVELLNYLSTRSHSPSIQTVSYHMGDKISESHIKYLCNKHLTRRIPEGMKLNIYIWPQNELHDRYILTDNGGVSYGIGLDENDGGSSEEVAINRICDTEYRKWWKMC